MKRRDFIRKGLPLAAIPFVSNNLVASVLNPFSLKPETISLLNLNTDKILIIINLPGGNDGLSTVYSEINNTTSNILGGNNGKRSNVIPSMETTTIDPSTGLSLKHNEMIQSLINLKNDNKVAIIQGVGSPGNTGSHFASDDIFQMGLRAINSPGGREGLIGKYFNQADYQSNPNYSIQQSPQSSLTTCQFTNINDSPLAIHVGGRTPRSFITSGFNQYYTVSPNFSSQNTNFGFRTSQNCSYYQQELDFIQSMFSSTRDYNCRVLDAFNTGNLVAGDYNTDKPTGLSVDAENFVKSMKLIATLIKGGLGAKIYNVNLNGFDTHTNQIDTHNMLLSALDYGISKFVTDLSNTTYANNVMGVTFSEFGRRIVANGSTSNAGTDHGHSSPSFMFGCSNNRFSGNSTILGNGGLFGITTPITASTNTVIEYDYREVYSAIIQKWFGVPPSDLNTIIEEDSTGGTIVNPFSHSQFDTNNNLTRIGKIMEIITT